MIGQLNGILIEKQPPMLLLDVNGVGYEVFASMGDFYEGKVQVVEVEHGF